jgi:hypothetical protein
MSTSKMGEGPVAEKEEMGGRTGQRVGRVMRLYCVRKGCCVDHVVRGWARSGNENMFPLTNTTTLTACSTAQICAQSAIGCPAVTSYAAVRERGE